MKETNLNRAGSKVVLWMLTLAMLAFTITRTLHFLVQTFPPDQAYVSYLALAAFDIGVLGWLYYATNAAEGTGQRVVGYGMIFVCASGVIVTTIADMLMVSAKNGVTVKMPPDVATAALWAVMIVISLDFFAGILVHLLDPKHQKHMTVENAKDIVHKASMEAIKKRAGEIAPRVADQVANYWADQVVQDMIGHIPGISVSEVKTVDALPSGESNKLLANVSLAQEAAIEPVKEDGPKNARKRVRRAKKEVQPEENTQTTKLPNSGYNTDELANDQ